MESQTGHGVDPTGPRSRRGVLAAAAAALAGLAARGIARATPAAASDGDPIVMGQHNFATNTTYVDTGSNRTLHVTSVSSEAIFAGGAGNLPTISASSYANEAVVGVAEGPPLSGTNGVRGTSSHPTASGVYGENLGGGFGVAGRSNLANGTGTYGEALGSGGVGVSALAGATGTALRVSGVAEFSQSGIVKIGSGRASVTVPVAGLTSGCFALATLQTAMPGTWVQSAVPSVTASTVTIHINQPAPQAGRIAYLVLR